MAGKPEHMSTYLTIELSVDEPLWIPQKDWIGFRIRDFLMYFLTDETVDTDEYMCHQTRPVLLPTGWADIPYPWHPSVVDIGIYQIGNFYILSGWFLIDR